jgi:hypothetical protein
LSSTSAYVVVFKAKMSHSERNARFFNYPNPRALEHPYQAPPPPKNPVIKGTALHYLSNLYVQSVFKPDHS